MTLLEKTLYLVRNRPVSQTYANISAATGISTHWIKTFASGNIADPSVNKVELIYNHLSASPLNFEGEDNA